MRVTERPFSDLLRHPKDVTDDVVDGDVVLRRRDEPDLWLSRVDRETERSDTFAALAHAMQSLGAHAPTAVARALPEVFPWLDFLPDADRRRFVTEFSRTVAAAAELENLWPLTQLLREWRATAEVHADPKLARRLRRPIQAAGEPVPMPA